MSEMIPWLENERGVHWLVEQPMDSYFYKHPKMAKMIEDQDAAHSFSWLAGLLPPRLLPAPPPPPPLVRASGGLGGPLGPTSA